MGNVFDHRRIPADLIGFVRVSGHIRTWNFGHRCIGLGRCSDVSRFWKLSRMDRVAFYLARLCIYRPSVRSEKVVEENDSQRQFGRSCE